MHHPVQIISIFWQQLQSSRFPINSRFQDFVSDSLSKKALAMAKEQQLEEAQQEYGL